MTRQRWTVDVGLSAAAVGASGPAAAWTSEWAGGVDGVWADGGSAFRAPGCRPRTTTSRRVSGRRGWPRPDSAGGHRDCELGPAHQSDSSLCRVGTPFTSALWCAGPGGYLTAPVLLPAFDSARGTPQGKGDRHVGSVGDWTGHQADWGL